MSGDEQNGMKPFRLKYNNVFFDLILDEETYMQLNRGM